MRGKRRGLRFWLLIGTFCSLFLLFIVLPLLGLVGRYILSKQPVIEIVNASPHEINQKAIFAKTPLSSKEVYLWQQINLGMRLRFSAKPEIVENWLREMDFDTFKKVKSEDIFLAFGEPDWFDVASITNGRISQRDLEGRTETVYIDDLNNRIYFMVIYH